MYVGGSKEGKKGKKLNKWIRLTNCKQILI